MDGVSDNKCTIDYHHARANVVVDALSKKSYGQLSSLMEVYTPNFFDLRKRGVQL